MNEERKSFAEKDLAMIMDVLEISKEVEELDEKDWSEISCFPFYHSAMIELYGDKLDMDHISKVSAEIYKPIHLLNHEEEEALGVVCDELGDVIDDVEGLFPISIVVKCTMCTKPEYSDVLKSLITEK